MSRTRPTDSRTLSAKTRSAPAWLASTVLAAAWLAGPALAQTSEAPATQAPVTQAPVTQEPAAAPDTPSVSPDTVIATVNGKPITEGDLRFAPMDPNAQMTPEQRRLRALATMIELRTIVDEAERAGLANEDFEASMRAVRERQLARLYMEQNVEAGLDDATLRARYDAEIAKFVPTEEIRASHILLETEDEAKAVIAELEGGADFAKLAEERSTGPSGPNGGDLGFFGPGRMVPAFDAAARALEVGAVSPEPVQTQFGYHVIKVTDTRSPEPPAFEAVRDQLRAIEAREREIAMVERLRGDAEIEVLDETLGGALGDPDGSADADAAAAPAAE